MKRIVALMLAILMVFAIVACDKGDEEPSESESSETTTVPTDDNDDKNDDENQGGDNQGGDNQGGDNQGGDNQGGDNQGGDNQGGDNQGGNQNPPAPVPADFELVKAGIANYVIISKDINYDTMATKFAEDLTEKTGALFMVKEKLSSSEKALYVGTTPSTILGSKLTNLTYNGYVMHEMSSNIHLTGYTQATIQASIDAFLATITPEICSSENGKLTVTMPGEMLKIYNPEEGYAYRNATLLGKSISEFVLVLPANYTVYDRFVADELIARIGADTGYKLEYIKDSKMTANQNQIVIGKTSRAYSATVYEGLPTDAYLIKSEGTCVYAAYDNYLVSTEVAAVIAAICRENAQTVDKAQSFDYSSYLFERTEGTDLRLMSNNVTVVLDALSYETKNNIQYTDRLEILSQMYLKYMPDFVGLQEMQQGKIYESEAYFFDELMARVGHKYALLGQHNRMAAIIYQKDVWKLEASGQGQFNSMHPWYWGLFSRIDDPSVQVIVMDIHYAGEGVVFDHNNKYADGPAEYDGKTNGQVINAIYNQLAETYAGVPIFIMGDFNSKYSGANFNATIKNTTLDSASRLVRDENGNPAWGDHYTDASLNHGMFADPIDHILLPTDKADALAYRFINEALMNISSGPRPIMADIKLYPVVSGSGNGMDGNNGVVPNN